MKGAPNETRTHSCRFAMNTHSMYTHSMYKHSMTDVSTAALLPTKPSLDDDSGFMHGFGSEASLPLAQSTQAVTHDDIKLC